MLYTRLRAVKYPEAGAQAATSVFGDGFGRIAADYLGLTVTDCWIRWDFPTFPSSRWPLRKISHAILCLRKGLRYALRRGMSPIGFWDMQSNDSVHEASQPKDDRARHPSAPTAGLPGNSCCDSRRRRDSVRLPSNARSINLSIRGIDRDRPASRERWPF